MVSPALHSIVHRLEGLKQRASLSELYQLLKNSPLLVRDFEDRIRFDDHHCCRNVISSGPWHVLLLICWRQGQSSSVHDHADSACVFKVLAGACSETGYGFTIDGRIYPIEHHTHETGAIVLTQGTDTHQIANLQSTGENLVTLHVYSPPLKSMRTFSPSGKCISQSLAPDRLQLTGGNGI
jgi:cysteine dioxygenase